MSIVFTAIQNDLIVMAVDSIEKREFASGSVEFVHGVVKSYYRDGVGCVATWGERVANKVAGVFNAEGVEDVEALARQTNAYLTNEYRPHEMGGGEVGYHVAGFDAEGNPKLHHIFWEPGRTVDGGRPTPQYVWQLFPSPAPTGLTMLYNGRSEPADRAVRAFADEASRLIPTGRGDPRRPWGLVHAADAVVRFVSEVTTDAGPPFAIHVIGKGNRMQHIVNDGWCRLEESTVDAALDALGFGPRTHPHW